jgi:hypothetical protein
MLSVVKKMKTNNEQYPCGDCRLTHDITASARQHAYEVIYRAQKDRGDKLSWQEERDLFHEAIHQYESNRLL